MKSLYESAWHLPGTAWLACAAFLVLLLVTPRERAPARGLFAGLTVLAAVDAWLNGPLSPIANAPPWASTACGLAFVLAGDLRYFVLVDRMLAPRAPFAKALARSVGLTFVVPVLSIPLRLAPVPERVLWLGYELAFFALTLLLRAVVWPRRADAAGASEDARRAAHALTTFELAQYGLWAGADLLLLAGLEVGWLVRLVPNTLYYAAFLPFAESCWTRAAPERARGRA